MIFFCSQSTNALPDWGQAVKVSKPRNNIYDLNPNDFASYLKAGKQHAYRYPVSVTGLVFPDKMFKRILNGESKSFVHRLATKYARKKSGFKSFESFQDWMGLLRQKGEVLRVGETRMQRGGVDGLTYSCGVCHVGELFGKKVFGLTNRFPRANAAFVLVQQTFDKTNPSFLRFATQTNGKELKLIQENVKNLQWVGQREPVVVGLDSSLAQVALSLAKRKQDKWASMTKKSAKYPRYNKLSTHVADSKPSVWWNLKYKNRWLSDGSVRSGNPIFTNFLWNELGRGTELRQLSKWLKFNKKTVDELTAAVFATKPPRIESFFPDHQYDLAAMKRGQKQFRKYCVRCHGDYKKVWEKTNTGTVIEKMQTSKVLYPQRTLVKNVGTDPGRYLGMQYFSDRLNELEISQNAGTVVIPTNGYVPPPLVGIWARWPYLHNNSISSLCDLLTPASMRRKKYYAVKAIDKNRDFDFECNGYPTTIADEFKKREYLFDTSKKGLSNAGHDDGIFLVEGNDVLPVKAKKDLVAFLQSL